VTGNDHGHVSPFTRARQIVGVGLFGLVVVLSIIDAFSTDYEFGVAPMALMLGTASTLLGVEIFERIGKKINGQ
jgi:hypothetical protein